MTPATVAAWIDQGHLKGHRTPTGRRRVASGDLIEFLRAHGMAVPADLEGNGSGGARGVVVVVDDEPAYLRALVRFLEEDAPELEVIEATTGMDALVEIARRNPDLVVLDYRLPDLNAVQVVERLLDPSRRLTAEVMVVTGGMPLEAEAALRRAGVRTVIDKADGIPVVVEAIRAAVKARKVA